MKKETLYGPLVFILLWYILYLFRIVNPLFLPSPHAVVIEMARLLTQLGFWIDILSTLWRTIVGFSAACAIGIPIGLVMGQHAKVNSALEIIVDFSRSLPAIAIYPLFLFFFGIGDTAKVATTIFSCSLIVMINTAYGVTSSKKTRQTVAHLMEASRREIFRKVILMDALPQIFIGLRTSLSFAIIVVVATEMFIGNLGMGHRIYDAQLTFRAAEMFASIIFTGLIGYGMNRGFIVIENKIVHWRGK